MIVAAKTMAVVPSLLAGDLARLGDQLDLVKAAGCHWVSVDVMDDSGMAMTSDVIAAADWIYQHKDESNIRVANFSLQGSAPSSLQVDPGGNLTVPVHFASTEDLTMLVFDLVYWPADVLCSALVVSWFFIDHFM